MEGKELVKKFIKM